MSIERQAKPGDYASRHYPASLLSAASFVAASHRDVEGKSNGTRTQTANTMNVPGMIRAAMSMFGSRCAASIMAAVPVATTPPHTKPIVRDNDRRFLSRVEADIPKTPSPNINTPGRSICSRTKAPPAITKKENRNSKIPPTAKHVEARRTGAGIWELIEALSGATNLWSLTAAVWHDQGALELRLRTSTGSVGHPGFGSTSSRASACSTPHSLPRRSCIGAWWSVQMVSGF